MRGARESIRLALALVVAAAASLAWASVPAPEDADEAIPLPRTGDVAVFEFRVPDVTRGHTLTFQWAGTDDARDAAGERRVVDVLHAIPAGPRPLPSGLVPSMSGFVGREFAPLLYEDHSRRETGSDPAPFTQDREDEHAVRHYDASLAAFEPCAARSGWQGRLLDDVTGMDLYEACPTLRPHATWAVSAPLHPTGTVRHGNMSARAFRAELPHEHEDAWVEIHLASGVPYPLLLAVRNDETWWELRLTGYAGGSTPLAAPPITDEGGPRSGLAFEPLPEWGVVTGEGLALMLPHEDAVAAAAGPLAPPTVAEYRAEHPASRVVAFRYVEDHHDYYGSEGRAPAWWFLLNDPSGEGFEVTVRRAPVAERWGATVDAGAAPLLLVDGRARALPPLDPERLPTRTLTLSDAARLWALEFVDDPRLSVNRVEGVLQPGLSFTVNEDVPAGAVLVGHVEYASRLEEDECPCPRHVNEYHRSDLALDASTGRSLWATTSVREIALRPSHSSVLDPAGAPSPSAPVPDDRGFVLVPAAALGVLALLLAFGRAALDACARVLLVPLYSRLRRDRALDHARRQLLLATIRARPGIRLRDLAAEAPMGRGALLYHLSVLEREGFLQAVRTARARRFFHLGEGSAADARAEARRLDADVNRYLATIRGNPGATQRELANLLGVSEVAAHRAVRKLEAAGVVERRREGRSMRVYAAAASAPTTPTLNPKDQQGD